VVLGRLVLGFVTFEVRKLNPKKPYTLKFLFLLPFLILSYTAAPFSLTGVSLVSPLPSVSFL